MKKKLSTLLILIMLSVVFTPFLPPAATEQSPLSLLTTEAEAASSGVFGLPAFLVCKN